MATTNEFSDVSVRRITTVASEQTTEAGRSLWDFLMAGRPMVGLVAVLCTTAGHAMNLREMGVAQGWVPAIFYILQSSYLVGLSLMMLACPALGQYISCRTATHFGLLLAAGGAFLNGYAMWAPFEIFVLGRVAAGVGSGMVIYFAPRLLDDRWKPLVTWAAILCPAAGTGVIAAATMSHAVSDWEWGFYFEGAVALVSLLLLLTMTHGPQTTPSPPCHSLVYLVPLVFAAAALVYCQHWGQLQGWMESLDIVALTAAGVAASVVSLWLVWPHLDLAALKENWLRLLLYSFGGMCQFFHGFTMNTYGGSIINFSAWQRAWLIWPMPIGIGVALALQYLPWRRTLKWGLPSAIVGLLLLSGGLYLDYWQTMEWPFWKIFDTRDLNWFMAPSHWELAPGRYLMGLGVGLLMLSVDKSPSSDSQREEKVRPFFPIVQFFGGAIGAGLFVNFLLIGQLVHYSYSADRGFIQADELARRREVLTDDFRRVGKDFPERSTQVMIYRFVRYEADNMVFATIYAAFAAGSLLLAGLTLVVWGRRRLQRSKPVAPTIEKPAKEVVHKQESKEKLETK